jgi:hypothetical protein
LEGVAVKTSSATFAIVTRCVVLANTTATFGIANVGVSVTIARDATSKRTTIGGLVTETWSARFAILSNVTIGTVATFNPVGR